MLWLRETSYHDPNRPITFVIAQDGLKDNIYVSADSDRATFGRDIDVEVFEWEDDLGSATLEAERRARSRLPEKTHLMDTLHDFIVAACVKSKKGTVISPRSQTPLDAVDIRQILLAVMRNPFYGGQVVMLRSKDRKGVMLEGDQVLVQDL